MRQYEAVIQAMRENGGYATLGQLYRTATKIEGCRWGTKTPFASIRRIVQVYPNHFFRIRPGLWALASERDAVLSKLKLDEKANARNPEVFNHSYYQGLLIEIGNLTNHETFVPHQDKNKPFLERRLSEVATLKEFYNFTYDSLLRRARTVDVSWFNNRKFPEAFFEVEHSTDIQNSLLKFVEFQDFKIRFYIVADKARLGEFQKKMGYTAFTSIRSEVNFLDYESLSDLHSKVSARAAARLDAKL
ncbi:MAG TPA: hypothetical protein VLJ61_09220 [Pyrinomonadaceae bacterium]|nr:hypothetical protein [Pyrinomonadaceae bacterium]